MRLALEKIAALENIVIAYEELDGEYQKLADMYNVQLENVKAMIPAKNLKEDVAVERAMTFVRENAVVTTAE